MQDSVKIWVDGLSNRAEGTRKLYLGHFNRFIKRIEISPDQLREMKWQEDKSEKPWERNQVENIVREYLKKMEEEEGLSCAYAQASYVAIKSFFKKNGLPLFMDSNDRPDGEGFGSVVPTKEQIKRIVQGAGTLRYRALSLFLKDSGLRISDVLRLRWGDLKPYGEDFLGLTILTKKKKVKAHPFVGSETVEALKLYKQKRLQGTRRIPPEQNIEMNYLFCARAQPTKALAVTAVSKNIGDIIRRLGYESLTVHGFRKFWEQSMKADREAYLKQLNGRKMSKVEAAYLTKNPQDLFEIYRQNYDNLRVLEGAMIRQDEIEALVEKRVEDRVKELREQVKDLTFAVQELSTTWSASEKGKRTIDTIRELGETTPKANIIDMAKVRDLRKKKQKA